MRKHPEILFKVEVEHDNVGGDTLNGLHKLEMGRPAFIGDYIP